MLTKFFDLAVIRRKLKFNNGATIEAIQTDGTSIAVSIAELVALNDLGATDLAKIDGITNGTAAANKALVLGASKEIATITSATITTLTAPNMAGAVTFADGTTDVDFASHDGTNGVKLGGTLVTSSAAGSQLQRHHHVGNACEQQDVDIKCEFGHRYAHWWVADGSVWWCRYDEFWKHDDPQWCCRTGSCLCR